MASLTETLTNENKKAAVVDDCCALIDAEVADKGGISGLAIKAGYSAVKNIKPGFIRHAVVDLLPDFAKALDPLFQEAKTGGKPVGAHIASNSGRAADALLAITDGKVRNAQSGLVKGTYEKLRGTAKKNVEAAIPRIGKLIEKHGG
ncbi:DUF6918 family protein [Archangium gephyra]|uniref:DUF6918 family protein n=1 Tax=Archangium gephyra TaxID=48 RepID=UPI003B7D948B